MKIRGHNLEKMTGIDLAAWRKRMGWTQKRAAEYFGVSPHVMRLQERSEKPLDKTVRLLVVLAENSKDIARAVVMGIGERRARGFDESGLYAFLDALESKGLVGGTDFADYF